eukprot:TRINITY_DN15941_c0_g1_i1.p1 TRINITY_DN15941_c0_g1~~TRINITY_DN15941_c0_g1_i1.p1  ORF type:complete len:648 (+),score=138.44 TRINITY_DN15941_c0_g1_i1:139-1944(+)
MPSNPPMVQLPPYRYLPPARGEWYDVDLTRGELGLGLRFWALPGWTGAVDGPAIIHICGIDPGCAAAEAGVPCGQLVAIDGVRPASQPEVVNLIHSARNEGRNSVRLLVAEFLWRYTVTNPHLDDLGIEFEVLKIEGCSEHWVHVISIREDGIADRAVLTPRSRELLECTDDRFCADLLHCGLPLGFHIVSVDDHRVSSRLDFAQVIADIRARRQSECVISVCQRPWEFDLQEAPDNAPPQQNSAGGAKAFPEAQHAAHQWRSTPTPPGEMETPGGGSAPPTAAAVPRQQNWLAELNVDKATSQDSDVRADWPPYAADPQEEEVLVVVDGEQQERRLVRSNLCARDGGPPRIVPGARNLVCGLTGNPGALINGQWCTIIDPDEDPMVQVARGMAAENAAAHTRRPPDYRKIDWVQWIRAHTPAPGAAAALAAPPTAAAAEAPRRRAGRTLSELGPSPTFGPAVSSALRTPEMQVQRVSTLMTSFARSVSGAQGVPPPARRSGTESVRTKRRSVTLERHSTKGLMSGQQCSSLSSAVVPSRGAGRTASGAQGQQHPQRQESQDLKNHRMATAVSFAVPIQHTASCAPSSVGAPLQPSVSRRI